MNDTNHETPTVTRTLVPEDQRLATIERLFGVSFPLMIEPVIYRISDRMAEAYSSGYWQYYTLDNGGFYMAPEGDQIYQVSCDNCWTGELSADALGITACLYSFSHLSFSRDEVFGRLMADHYHLLRGYMFEHPELVAILGAID